MDNLKEDFEQLSLDGYTYPKLKLVIRQDQVTITDLNHRTDLKKFGLKKIVWAGVHEFHPKVLGIIVKQPKVVYTDIDTRSISISERSTGLEKHKNNYMSSSCSTLPTVDRFKSPSEATSMPNLKDTSDEQLVCFVMKVPLKVIKQILQTLGSYLQNLKRKEMGEDNDEIGFSATFPRSRPLTRPKSGNMQQNLCLILKKLW